MILLRYFILCIFVLQTIQTGCQLTNSSKMYKIKGRDFFTEPYYPIVDAIDGENIGKLTTLVGKENINSKGAKNLSFLFYAFLNNKLKSFTLLLENGADCNTPFHVSETDSTYLINKATEADDITYFNLLLPKAKLDTKDDRGASVLHNAIYVNQPERLFKLLESGVDINIQDKKKQTALYLLCALNKLETAYALIQKGADVTIPNAAGSTVALLIQESKLPKDSELYPWLVKIKQALINKGVVFPVLRPWEK